MKIKCLIVVNGYKLIDSVKYCAYRLKEEFESKNIETTILDTSKVLVYLENNRICSKIKDYSFCVFLDKDYYISNMIEMSGIKVFNSAKSIEICDDKMKTYLALSNKGINMPKTISGPLNYSGLVSNNFLDSLLENLKLPIVIKENFGSQGSKVYLAENKEELFKIESKITANPRLFQEFINESKGEDYRLIIIGHKYIAGMRRFSTNGDFRSNINLGGSAEVVQIPQDYIDLAIRVSQILNLDYCGIDLLKSSKGPILCEVNSNAFFKKIEEITKINIAKAYVEHILNNI